MKKLCSLVLLTGMLLTACSTLNLNSDEAQKEDEFIGIFSADNASMDIYKDDEGSYIGEISIEKDEDTLYTFSFTGKASGKSIKYTDGILRELTYDEDGDFEETITSENTKGKITKNGENYIWEDSTQEEEIIFVSN